MAVRVQTVVFGLTVSCWWISPFQMNLLLQSSEMTPWYHSPEDDTVKN
jgi:hypothetical protein